MSAKRVSILSGTLVVVLVSALLAQSRQPVKPTIPSDARGSARILATPIELSEDPLSRVSLYISDDGRLELAGVKRFEIDEGGRAVVELYPDGDFESDPTLSLNVPVELETDGTLFTSAIRAIGFDRPNIVLTIQTLVPGMGGVAERVKCAMRKPIPSGDVFCAGPCPLVSQVCDFMIDDEGDLKCDCQVPER